MSKRYKISLCHNWGQTRRVIAPCAGLLGLLLTNACTTGSDPFRAVGADSPTQSEVAMPVAVDSQVTATTPATESGEPLVLGDQPAATTSDPEAANLQEGTLMNLATSAESSDEPADPADIPPAPEMAKTREEAIQQIRAKAAATGNNKPHIFEERKAATQRMSKQEQAQIAAEMEKIAARNAQTLDENAADAKGNDSKLLQWRAKNHYNEAVEKIEN